MSLNERIRIVGLEDAGDRERSVSEIIKEKVVLTEVEKEASRKEKRKNAQIGSESPPVFRCAYSCPQAIEPALLLPQCTHSIGHATDTLCIAGTRPLVPQHRPPQSPTPLTFCTLTSLHTLQPAEVHCPIVPTHVSPHRQFILSFRTASQRTTPLTCRSYVGPTRPARIDWQL